MQSLTSRMDQVPPTDLGELLDLTVHSIHNQGESPLEFGAQFLESLRDSAFDTLHLLCLQPKLC